MHVADDDVDDDHGVDIQLAQRDYYYDTKDDDKKKKKREERREKKREEREFEQRKKKREKSNWYAVFAQGRKNIWTSFTRVWKTRFFWAVAGIFETVWQGSERQCFFCTSRFKPGRLCRRDDFFLELEPDQLGSHQISLDQLGSYQIASGQLGWHPIGSTGLLLRRERRRQEEEEKRREKREEERREGIWTAEKKREK